MEKEEVRRLFFGVEAHAPWPKSLPAGRLLDENQRHLTLAFLGNTSYPLLKGFLADFPEVPMLLGETGYFDSCISLPPRHPYVIAWHAVWHEMNPLLASFQKTLSNWLQMHNYSVDTRQWMPHVTLCRQPFDPHIWKKTFTVIPFYTSTLHLYESIGKLLYSSLWSYPILPPFKEIEHTADMAFLIYGKTLQNIYHNALTALAFKFPPLLKFSKPTNFLMLDSLDDLVILLNQLISDADGSIGCPLKAVSYHGDLVPFQNTLLQWEMIVDV